MLRIQQKSTQKILLFSVAAQKVEKIKALCKNLGISVQQVEKSDYGQKLGAIAGITGFKKDGSRYSGADFPAELLVYPFACASFKTSLKSAPFSVISVII